MSISVYAINKYIIRKQERQQMKKTSFDIGFDEYLRLCYTETVLCEVLALGAQISSDDYIWVFGRRHLYKISGDNIKGRL